MKIPAVAILAALAACEGVFVPPTPYPPPPAKPASVSVTPDSAAVITDDTLRLTAVVRDSAGNVLSGTPLSWTSADSTVVAILNALGTVRGQRPGVTTIRAFAGSVSGSVHVFVTALVFNGVAAGTNHVCGITNNQHAYCWGDNDDAEVGTGVVSFVEPVPRRVALAPAQLHVAAGGAHSCVLDAAGAAYCWGRAANGRLGRGSTPGDPAVPAAVATGLRFVALAAGGAHTCGLTDVSRIACWGANASGQLGGAGPGDQPAPQPVIGDTPWTVVTAGTTHTCALATDSTAACWGANGDGQLGDSTTSDRPSPAAVAGGLRFAVISAGGSHTCAATASGTGYCWGRNASGQSGTGLADSLLTSPTPIAGGLSLRAVAAGGQHSCGIAADSTAYCWGANGAGQLGDSSQAGRPTPVPVHGALRFRAIGAGATYTCGLTGGLVLYCWGDGTQGQLGRPTVGTSSVPVRVAGQ